MRLWFFQNLVTPMHESFEVLRNFGLADLTWLHLLWSRNQTEGFAPVRVGATSA
jgi:hypothetical protein